MPGAAGLSPVSPHQPTIRTLTHNRVAKILEKMSGKGGKGGKKKKRGRGEEGKRELVFKEDGQGRVFPSATCFSASFFFEEYAQVMKMLGNGRLEAHCFDGKKRLAHIRGKMRKREWVNVGDIILLGLRDFQDDKADVIMKYQPDEARKLKACDELPASANVGGLVEEDGDNTIEDSPFVFEEVHSFLWGEGGRTHNDILRSKQYIHVEEDNVQQWCLKFQFSRVGKIVSAVYILNRSFSCDVAPQHVPVHVAVIYAAVPNIATVYSAYCS